MHLRMTLTEFSAKCLGLFDKLSRQEIEFIDVTKRGRLIAIVWPPRDDSE